jgi:hypothetical protein
MPDWKFDGKNRLVVCNSISKSPNYIETLVNTISTHSLAILSECAMERLPPKRRVVPRTHERDPKPET